MWVAGLTHSTFFFFCMVILVSNFMSVGCCVPPSPSHSSVLHACVTFRCSPFFKDTQDLFQEGPPCPLHVY
ncbi:hypothetical protein GDO78_003954 [Eleutherodactylus coqui]|uniref:Secreted protein n=1 Tax=Eleutherodactylus coqui TaxID=57060 RepID=A0A8J6JZU8_ELECQ|nr:hypothetical protein GDO78_003954 [Eleutherodactylus coqui]